MERKAYIRRVESRHRREVWRERRRQHLRRLRLFAGLAWVGVVILGFQITAEAPVYWEVGLGLILVMPFLAEVLND
jgi:hypothetical protein